MPPRTTAVKSMPIYEYLQRELYTGTWWELRKWMLNTSGKQYLIMQASIVFMHLREEDWQVNEFVFFFFSTSVPQIFVHRGSVCVPNMQAQFSLRGRTWGVVSLGGLDGISPEVGLRVLGHAVQILSVRFLVTEESTDPVINLFLVCVCNLWGPLRAQGPFSLGQSMALFRPYFLCLEMEMHQFDWIYPHSEG